MRNGKTVGELSEIESLLLDDVIPVFRNGKTYKISIRTIAKNYMNGFNSNLSPNTWMSEIENILHDNSLCEDQKKYTILQKLL